MVMTRNTITMLVVAKGSLTKSAIGLNPVSVAIGAAVGVLVGMADCVGVCIGVYGFWHVIGIIVDLYREFWDRWFRY